MSITRYRFELARSEQEISAYYQLRKAIFCEEQGLFVGNDEDDLDSVSYPIIAIDDEAPAGQNVVGVVRIYENQPRLWYGGRLGVHPEYRRVGRIGKGLIHKAVTTANGWGCDQFLATVQIQNVRFFRRLHWDTIDEIQVLGHPHHLMEADLAFYPPGDEDRSTLMRSMLQVS